MLKGDSATERQMSIMKYASEAVATQVSRLDAEAARFGVYLTKRQSNPTDFEARRIHEALVRRIFET